MRRTKRKKPIDLVGLITLTILGLALILWVLPNACTHPKRTISTLEGAGYTEVEFTGWRPFMRSDEDWFSTGFKAKGPNGSTVTGAVTGGLIFKGNTIRTD